MIFHALLIIVILSNFHEGIKGHFLNTNSARNKKDLFKIIEALNDETKYSEDNNKIGSKDTSVELSDSEKERKLQEITRLLKMNYNGQKHYNDLINNPLHSGSRLYFIKNPDVLNEYKKYLKKKKIITLTSEEVDINYDEEDNRKHWNELKRRTEFRTASTELSENDFDRAESQEYKEPINERSDEATQAPLSDYVQDKHSMNADDPLVRKPPRKVDLKEVIKEIQPKVHDETKEDSFEVHKKRAQNEKSDNNLVRREKIEWSESNDKNDRDVSKKNDEIEKPYRFTKKKQKNVDNRREKRIYDNPTTEREIKYKPKPKINYRKPKIEVKKDYFSYGRTSIPFIGKKGIYEDK